MNHQQRNECQINLKRIGLAMHGYYDVVSRFLSAVIADIRDDGQPVRPDF